ncbi:MAG TPA: peroxidase family protein [Pyrinomonadaceae bacterium]|nr:peroxidase family protein [Pyrinomonadaceae bacterium]
MSDSFFSRTFGRIGELFTRKRPWYELPTSLALARIFRIRERLRDYNLHDTTKLPSVPLAPLGKPEPRHLKWRTVDGTYNDLGDPRMGSVGTRFGRNVPLEEAVPDEGASLVTPSPRTVSVELMTRREFQPATILNLLAAAWIQFEIHDWMSHGKNEKENPIEVPLRGDDDWPERPMLVRRTRHDPTRPPSATHKTPSYVNTETHWWDGSQIYGTDLETMTRVRTGEGGKLRIGSDGLLPVNPHTGFDISGVTGNWWIGLALLHTLFTLEHNAICDRLRTENKSWSDEELFSHARLINAALMAKIHTVEWTPAILATPTLKIGMNGNWVTITNSRADHHKIPYSLTEEFVTVYRMHPLMPDDFTFRSMANGAVLQQRSAPEVLDRHARELMTQISMPDLFYSFGTMHPGAITLHNFPRFLQKLERPDAPLIDLATVDILRDRERGVPRYNAFRQMLDMPPVKTFEELTPNKAWAEEIRRVYNNDINRVDTMVGMYAEQPPPGFGFSDTAFRIFILMASRRLQSDRFFTTDYNAKTYTKTGLNWIKDNTMSTVLKRHYPPLGRFLDKVDNAFAPWPRIA